MWGALLGALLLVAAVPEPVAAMFGGKGSGVQELNAKTLPKFISGHKPVMLLLYAPWCGHCKAIHPDWEKLGKSLEGIVKVGAVDCDREKAVAQQYGVKGFPTIKMIGMATDGKKKRPTLDYQQARSFAAMKQAALNLISSKNVLQLTEKKAAELAESKAPHVILFTKKNKTPPLYSVVSQSPKLKERLSFFIVQEKKGGVGEKYDVPSWPAVAVFDGDEAAPRWMPVEQKTTYKKLAEFVNGSGDKDKDKDTEENKDKEKPSEKTEEKPKKPVKHDAPKAEPTPLLELGAQTIKRCTKGALCIVYNGPKEDLDVSAEKRVLFYYPPSQEVLSKLTAALEVDDLPAGSSLLIRPADIDGTAVKVTTTSSAPSHAAEQASSGDLSFKKKSLPEGMKLKALFDEKKPDEEVEVEAEPEKTE